VCHDPSLRFPERFLRVALEIRRIDVLFVGFGVSECGAGFFM